MQNTILKSIKAFCFILLFSSFCSTSNAELSDEQRAETYKQLELFANVLSILQENYIEEIEPSESIEGAINGLLSSLDPHSSFLNEDDYKELQDDTQGAFSGIGIEVTVKDGQLTIIAPIEGTPGDRAGLRAKDLIMKINGVPTREMSPEQAIKKLRGKKGTEVVISIYRKELPELLDFTIIRDIISIQSVNSYFLSPGLAYSRITNFQRHTTKDLKKSLISLEKETPIKGLILDLRNNPGGLLDQAVAISDIFLEEGLIVYTKGRSEDQNLTFHAINTDASYEFPLIVLVNEGTASASEIVSGALQDHKRAIIVGTTTFGKGSVQTIIPLASGTGLKMTTARYYTPSGRSIQEKGIVPDVIAKLSNSSDDDSKSKTVIREKDLKNHFENSAKKDQVKKDLPNEKISRKLQEDSQLNTAYNILKSLQLYSEFDSTKQNK